MTYNFLCKNLNNFKGRNALNKWKSWIRDCGHCHSPANWAGLGTKAVAGWQLVLLLLLRLPLGPCCCLAPKLLQVLPLIRQHSSPSDLSTLSIRKSMYLAKLNRSRSSSSHTERLSQLSVRGVADRLRVYVVAVDALADL